MELVEEVCKFKDLKELELVLAVKLSSPKELKLELGLDEEV